VYITPKVNGIVIDASSLKPARLVLVTQPFNLSSRGKVVTDVSGTFKLTAYSEMQARLLMAGHALADYTLMFSAQGVTNSFEYQATKVMFSEETINDLVLFLDRQPSVVALPPTITGKSTTQWQADLSSPRYADCPFHLGERIITQLATARKVFHHGNKTYTGLAYDQVRLSWNKYLEACNKGTVLNKAFISDIKVMYKEIAQFETAEKSNRLTHFQ